MLLVAIMVLWFYEGPCFLFQIHPYVFRGKFHGVWKPSFKWLCKPAQLLNPNDEYTVFTALLSLLFYMYDNFS